MSQSAGAGIMDAYSHERRPWHPVLEYATMGTKKKPAGPTADDVIALIRQLPGSELDRLADLLLKTHVESTDDLADSWICFAESIHVRIEHQERKKWERLITAVADSWKGQAKGRDLFWVNLLKDIAAEAKSQTGKMHAKIESVSQKLKRRKPADENVKSAERIAELRNQKPPVPWKKMPAAMKSDEHWETLYKRFRDYNKRMNG